MPTSEMAIVQARAATPFENIFPKFEFWGVNGDKAHQKMQKTVSSTSTVMGQ
jgi:hypothetical protein